MLAKEETPARDEGGGAEVAIVVTGGTVGSMLGSDGVVRIGSLTEQRLLSRAPLAPVSYPLRELSEDFQPGDWVTIAESVRSHSGARKDLAGVVVLHGTDTMAYTAAALSFVLSDLSVPVVLTGANRAPAALDSDASTNFSDAVVAAKNLAPGVYLSFSGVPGRSSMVHLGTRVRKLRAEGRAFASIGRPPVARVVDGSLHLGTLDRRPPSRRAALPGIVPGMPSSPGFEERVLCIRLYPGCPLGALARLVKSEDIRGVVIEMYASATGSSRGEEYSLERFTAGCVESGTVVVGTVGDGVLRSQGVYESNVSFRSAGGVLLCGMLPETATVKLMWALAASDDPSVLREILERDIAGELVSVLDDAET